MKTITIFILSLAAVGCTMDQTDQTSGAAATCPPSQGTVEFTDGTKLDCSDPAMTVTCSANDAACLCKRMTGDANQTSCTPCALQFPCMDDCQCVADHGTGWACVASSQGSDGLVFKGCVHQ
jgi:hypothetical protein